MQTKQAVTNLSLTAFARGYLAACLFSETDESNEQGGEPLDRNYSISDFTPEAIATAKADCRDFQEKNAALLDEANIDSFRAGCCFWWNRNGHGTGFWDEGNAAVFRKLSDACKPYGTCNAITIAGQIMLS